jgi:hypothetical protein
MCGDGSEITTKRSLKEKENNHLISWCLTNHGVEGIIFLIMNFVQKYENHMLSTFIAKPSTFPSREFSFHVPTYV